MLWLLVYCAAISKSGSNSVEKKQSQEQNPSQADKIGCNACLTKCLKTWKRMYTDAMDKNIREG